ncbi:hypothetical protein SLEP1_g46370 [Rubroshorea leprosula]|uniref:C2 DOCK-type domain-containing protein n=1 Tax=Rubroshorea leprosula TaxID=152421 RepID=A0AAV5LMN2_9ROSI|nr:hypothetical protein SLEP1_g46370 [Rubroshorea leprosula]
MRRLLLCCNSRHPSPSITLFQIQIFVSCDNVTGHVIALNLRCSFLYGTFPSNSTLFFLRNLQSLNLAWNDFRDSKIPSEISEFTRLKHLDISSSGFSGQVPAEIAHLSKLVSLNLSNSDLILETTLRNLVHNLSELRELVLPGVNMTSVNPRFFMNLSSSLTTLDLWRSALRGNFPNSIFRFPNLKRFSLGGKGNLTIDLPSSNWSSPLQRLHLGDMDCGRRLRESVGDLKSLQSLSLGCNWEGSIPASIGNLSQLTYLSLSYNNLSGQIPPSLANLTQLTSLGLSNNQFSGPFLASICNLRQLTSLFLYSNNLSGQIPSSLANLTQLTFVNLANNQFSGPIPASIGNLRQLTLLYLYSNNLSGQIPSSLANLTQLTFLDLSYNLLNGTLPPWIFTLPLLEYLYLNHNQFQGQINQLLQNSLISLDLSNNRFQGSIPNSIANLVNLSYLDLSSNHFSDLVELDMFSALQNLETIFLSDNNLSLRMNVTANFTLPKLIHVSFSSCNLSEFPNFIRHSNGLQSLVLSKNSIHGNIPEWICENDDLEILDLSHNNLIGKIPNCLPRSLSVLNLQANYFDGNILPSGFPEDCGLLNLNLHGNQMDGLLPRSLVNCRMLEILDVGNNNISDTFPHWLESLPDLQVLVLRSNKFHGSVQSTKESPSFPKLRVLDLSSNDFLGPLPLRYMENFKAMMDSHGDDGSPEYMKGILTVFSSIHLSNNKFEGEIPDVIGKLSSLKGLNLSHNNLTGHIPPSLGNLTNMEWLDLSSNELTGKIPDELVSLTQLSVLNLSNNHLVGRIPLGNQFNTFGNGSYEGNVGLCGIPLSKSCDGIGTPPSSFQEKDELWRFGWRVVVLGYGCGVFQAFDFRTTLRNEPFLQLFHFLYVYPLTVSLSWKRNPFVRVELRKDDADVHKQPLKAMYPREPGLSLQKWAHTQVAVGAGVGCYHDEIKVSLPAVWTPLRHLIFTFFHVDLQMKLEAPKPVSSMRSPKPVVIGYAALPLSTHAQYATAFMFVIFCFVSFLDDLLTYFICSATGVIGMVVHGYFPGLCCGYLDDINIVTLEDVVEEIVGEIFDENDSKEEIQKKIGFIVMRAEGVYDVEANSSIYLPSEDLNTKMPEDLDTSLKLVRASKLSSKGIIKMMMMMISMMKMDPIIKM